MKIITVPIPELFSYGQNLVYLKRSPNECMYRIEADRIYKAISLGEANAVIEVSEAEDGGLRVEIIGGVAEQYYGDNILEAIEEYVVDWFDLKRDLSPFYEIAASDPLLKETVDQFYGLRVMGIPDLFEALCWGIIGQQINLAFAYTLKRRFVELYGRAVEANGELHWLFPKAEDIALLTVADLEPLRMSVKKSEYLIEAAQNIVSGKLSKETLLQGECLKSAEALLVSIRGIGPWTAHYVIMRCLRFPSAFPIDDVGLHNSIKHITGMDRKPTKQELLKLSAGWGGWESYATFYLWRLLY
ncbi:DNA-3-methyladenine glycosylase [Paenibacillus sp. L3-i20]|uniref:DNA-3-methyladenine glycosylase family protein n=1 Tax=Paenibacillus sp. L3-i20 TaxID=2905833 RepID=UPI001EDE40A0|nr:DNA-3-methyladenine glycosylase [Paenibacillus sp. L3-i20]GKU76342.1 DNA-3-methyladenine glycosylase [Paenibacillus sp. L3-i20]